MPLTSLPPQGLFLALVRVAGEDEAKISLGKLKDGVWQKGSMKSLKNY